MVMRSVSAPQGHAGPPKGNSRGGTAVTFGGTGSSPSIAAGSQPSDQKLPVCDDPKDEAWRQVWINVFPDKPITKAGRNPHGRARATREAWVAVVKTSPRDVPRVSGVPEELARETLRVAGPESSRSKTKFVNRKERESEIRQKPWHEVTSNWSKKLKGSPRRVPSNLRPSMRPANLTAALGRAPRIFLTIAHQHNIDLERRSKHRSRNPCPEENVKRTTQGAPAEAVETQEASSG